MVLNEERILSDKFIFISYSHKDSIAVKEDMDALISRGVRVWFDENMRLGDDWTEIAARTISHENCVGVLFYNSANSFVSSAVQKEQALTKERADKTEFKYWSINLESKFSAQIYQEALTKALSESKNDYISVMQKQLEMFNDNILCILRSDSASAVSRIYEEIAIPYRLADNESNFMDDIKRKNIVSEDTDELIFGKYIDREYIGPEHADGSEDQRFGSANHLIQLNGKRYSSTDLRWKLLYVENGKAILLCTQILSQSSFYDGERFLKNIFPKIAFSAEETKKMGEAIPRFMTLADATKAQNAHQSSSLKLTEEKELVHWWIDEEGLTKYWKQTYSRDFHYAKGFSVFVKKGIRPIIEIPAKNFH